MLASPMHSDDSASVTTHNFKLCKNCKKSFEPKKAWQKFCATRCRTEYWDRIHPRTYRPENEESTSTDSLHSAGQ